MTKVWKNFAWKKHNDANELGEKRTYLALNAFVVFEQGVNSKMTHVLPTLPKVLNVNNSRQ
jgi:hypothetical protein